MSENKEYISYTDARGSVNISGEVIATIAASTALEVEGVAGLAMNVKDLTTLVGKKHISRSVKIKLEDDIVRADLYIAVDMGYVITDVAAAVQEAVKTIIESTIVMKTSEVNVNVVEVNFKNS